MSTRTEGRRPQSRAKERWRAVETRDPRSHGAFVYAVSTTGIFCRPTCPSRRPRRERVEFFDTSELALEQGYRACRRCHPDRPDPTRARMLELCRFLDGCDDRIPTLAELGERVGLSPAHLQRTFKSVVGVSPRAYAEARRDERLRARLRAGEPVLRAGFGAGFGAASRLYAHAADGLGMTPGRFRRGGRGETVRFAVASTALGELLVAATERGICRVALGDSAESLVRELEQELPHARLESDDEALRSILEPLIAHLAGSGAPLESLPLDVRATAFQRRVWQALRSIPPGETRSYGELARELGHPGGARAVARACASNPVALAIPCHRVVRGDGSPGGYRWGDARKRALLALESDSG